MAAMVKAKVASGEYATESEVIRDGLRTLLARDAAIESWLRGEVAKSYDEFAAENAESNPSKACDLSERTQNFAFHVSSPEPSTCVQRGYHTCLLPARSRRSCRCGERENASAYWGACGRGAYHWLRLSFHQPDSVNLPRLE
jgi:antitoxin ParD1/3/4